MSDRIEALIMGTTQTLEHSNTSTLEHLPAGDRGQGGPSSRGTTYGGSGECVIQ